MTKVKTNVQLVKEIMSKSKCGVLKEAFIIEAIAKYSEMTLKADKWGEHQFISQDAWKECAKECIEAIENRNK